MPANLPPRRWAPTPDIMNDSIYDVRPKSKSKNVEEMDTCRICRGEGSKEEPLFYPCKCNGSIKFVHQNCLMEWLSHSQKKHCELCKTPFRFTKLYHPHMPSTVPLLIFLRQAAVQSWKTFLTWSRFHLVLFVWIAWLPWCMRTVWRGLFWIGDGGWINWQKMEEQAFAAAQKRLDKLAAEGISPANAPLMLSKHTAASAVVSQVANALPHFLSPISQTFNATGGAPSVVRLAKTLIMGLIGGNSSDSATFPLSRTNDTNASPPTQRSPSWLSGLRFLRYLTRSHTMNNLIIDTLEGQLITLIVVITFILVFLIREWVVQQQPGMNIGAAPNAIPEVIQPPEAPAERIADQPVEQRRQPLPEPEGTAEGEADATLRELDPEPRIMARPSSEEVIAQMTDDDRYENIRSQGQDLRKADTAAAEDVSANLYFEDVTTEETLDAGSEQPLRKVSIRDPPNPSQRPSMPTRYALARATEIRRTLEEQSKASGHKDWPGLQIFMELWKRAESKPSEVLRIIEEEGRHEELSWIVAAMRKLENASSIDDDHDHKPSAIVGPFKDPLSDCLSVEGENYTIRDSQGRPKYPNAHPALETEAQHPGTDSKTERDIDNIVDSVRSQSSNGEDCSVVDIATARDSEGKSLFLQALEGSDIAQDPEIHSSWSNAGWPRDWDHFSDQSGSVGSSRGEVRATTIPPENLDSDAEITNDPNAEFDNTSQEAAPQGPQNVAVVHQNLADTVFNWLWGEVDPQVNPPIENTDQEGGDDEQIVNNLADEAPFVPVGNHRPIIEEAEIAENAEAEENAEDENPVQDQGLLVAAVQAEVEPNGADAPEEGEELEGIMELVGMQGPLAGLIQNGMFCAVLVSVTMFLSMWIPYIAGKMFLVFLANPVSLLLKAPLRWASASADLIIDLGIFSASCAFYWVDTAIRILCAPIGWIIPSLKNISQNKILAETAKEYAENAMERLAKILVATGGSLSESDIPTFSIIAHESLRLIEYRTAYMMQLIHIAIGTVVKFTQYHTHDYKGVFTFMINSIVANASDASDLVAYKVREMKILSPASFRFNPLHISLSIPQRVTPLDYSLAYWDTKDRMLAIMFGYLFFAFMGMSYLKFSVFFWGKNGRGRVDGAFADILYQAGGVLKVILIISIEMIVFPLYCGLLLDVALLPLFGNVTIISRLNFLINSPSTSLFVHWFVGTCYMFHFALFVSLCRKIMRKGVLYFIRDPDDPTFHPVRDVLERSVSTQLRKIAFSALVYGALVILCLGGVVWGIYFSMESIFPIHWSSNEPVLEFPVDLLFYNFLMPLAVKFFKPSVGLNKMYGWWFRKCARLLRLSHFLFGERKEDEEGYHVRHSWNDWLLRKQGDVTKPVIDKDRQLLAEDRDLEVFFLRDGRYVRAPASDQVRIPKDVNTFLEVDEAGARIDGLPDSDKGLHGSKNEMFSQVYIPPYFRLRISLFILLIWLFAATTGVSITIVPLVLGRFVFAHFVPTHLRMNDIYAFSIGLYLLGGTFYGILHYRQILAFVRSSFIPNPHSNTAALIRNMKKYMTRLARLLYTYLSFGFILPGLFSLLIEFYIVVPLHTYFGAPTDRHIIHFIQDWTLGVLYIKMFGRLILWNTPSRPADALRAIVRHGWLNPDIRLATRSFIFPASLLMVVALTVPLGFGWVVNQSIFADADVAHQSRVYRYSYPGVLALGMLVAAVWGTGLAFRRWRLRIRDEVYLIGERLHNFGERRERFKDKGKRVVRPL